jgi:predicted RNase H-like nuclease
MAVVLGVDAAWTRHKPSGVALVKGAGGSWCCLGAAPTYSTFVDLADGHTIDWSERRFDVGTADMDVLLAAARKLAGGEVHVVAIDMPMANCEISGRRAADAKVSREFGSRHCAAHSPSIDRPGELGTAMTRELQAAGFPLRILPDEQSRIPALIEVYPHPALLSLLGRSERVPYKVARIRRYWPNESTEDRKRKLKAELLAIHTGLTREFGDLNLPMSASESTRSLAALKRFEDTLDALVCAWAGVQFIVGKAQPLGDTTAAIWCPDNVIQSRRRNRAVWANGALRE